MTALDGPMILHLLGVGGIMTLAIWIGYGVMWLVDILWTWFDEGG